MARRRAPSNTTSALQKQPAQLKLTRKRGSEEVESVAGDVQENSAAGPKPSKRPKGDQDIIIIKQFRDQVTKDQKELGQLLERRLEHVEEEEKQRRNEFVSILGQGLYEANQPSRNGAPTCPEFAKSHLSTSVSQLSQSCQSLLSQYKSFQDMMVQMSNEQNSSITEVWAKDVAETEKLLGLGLNKAVRDVKRVLGLDAGETRDERMRIKGFEKEVIRDSELQKSLRYAERGVRKMVKGLPRREKGDVE